MSSRDSLFIKITKRSGDTNLKNEFAITVIDIPQSNLVVAITRTEKTHL